MEAAIEDSPPLSEHKSLRDIWRGEDGSNGDVGEAEETTC